MITHRKAKELLPPGDVVYTTDFEGRSVEAEVLEVCAGHLRATKGNLDFLDHGYTWWLTNWGVIHNTT